MPTSKHRTVYYLPFWLLAVLIGGISIASYLDWTLKTWMIIWASAFVSLIVLCLYLRKRTTRSWIYGSFSFLCVFLLGSLTYTLHQPKRIPSHYINNLGDYEGLIIQIYRPLKSTDYYHRYIGKVLVLGDKSVSGFVLIKISRNQLTNPFNPGALIFTYKDLDEIPGAKNPGQFDYKNYMQNKGIYHQLQLSSDEFFVAGRKMDHLVVLSETWRLDFINNLAKTSLSNETKSLTQALVLGYRNDLSEDTYQNYINAGAVHILAVSGLHVGIILMLINGLLYPLLYLRKGRWIRFILSILLLWCFALLAGFTPSIVRAVTMFTALALAWQSQRLVSYLHITAASAFLLLLLKPTFLWEIGFQLSYAAVFSIILINPHFQKLNKVSWKPIRYLITLLLVSVSAQIGVLPLSLFYFHQFPALFFISNLLIIPVLGLIMGLAILIVFLAQIHISPAFLIWPYEKLVSWMTAVVDEIASRESYIFSRIPFDPSMLLICGLLFLTIIYWLNSKAFMSKVLLLICLNLMMGIFIFRKYQSFNSREWVIFHHFGKSMLSDRHEGEGRLFTSDSLEPYAIDLYQQYLIKEGLRNFNRDTLPFYLVKDHEKLLIVEKNAIYASNLEDSVYVLLSHSPKIHLDRLIHMIRPKQIIVDGSNYPSMVKHWEKSCQKNNTPLHQTGKDGAWILKFKD